jgi:uncharacterized protein
MLGSMARKLRAFGFDAEYAEGAEDGALLARARATGRLLVTSDVALVARAVRTRVPAVLVTGSDDRPLIAGLIRGAKGSGVRLVRGEPRCSLCNGVLARVSKSTVAGVLPPGTADRHRLFYVCRGCGKVYWHGAHWKKLRRLERLFEE